MAKTAINVGSSANDGTGDPLRTAMQSTNSNIDEIYALFGNGSTLAISGDATVSAGALTIANDAVENAMIASGAVGSTEIAADAVTYAKLGAEFTTTAALSGTSVDWATATTFTKTLGSNTTLTFANVSTGMQINLVISGNYTLTLPSSVKELTNASTYDGSGENLISIVSTNGNTEQFATINKVA
jgi:hypothetical protein